MGVDREEMIGEFKKVLNAEPKKGQKEQAVQNYLELHPELIACPNLLNHRLHFEIVVSKFKLSVDFVTDLMYITKSSDTWRITFVELESPDKRLFTAATTPTPTAQFTAAMSQVRSWMQYVEEGRHEVLKRLEPLLRPEGPLHRAIEFCYQLVIGRSSDKNSSPSRKKYVRDEIKKSGVEILTYDSLIEYYRNGPISRKNVLRLVDRHFEFKYMHFSPKQIFSYVGPDALHLTDEQLKLLRADNYEIDEWQNGQLLVFNFRYTSATGDKLQKECMARNIRDLVGKSGG